ncbi:hypothetical protein AHF37_08077 [Paragonimus kellicotti]|nr:hypothetical protein AHF37_08077 [Paragonimus kellicotti]
MHAPINNRIDLLHERRQTGERRARQSRMAYPGHRIGPNGEAYNPTLKAPKEINLEQDCMALSSAMKGAGTDEDTVVDILGHRTLKQRLAIRDHYKATFGEVS